MELVCQKRENESQGEVSPCKREVSLSSVSLEDPIINFKPSKANNHLQRLSNIRKVLNQPQIKYNFYLKLSNSSNNPILYNSLCQLHLKRQGASLLGSTILPRTKIQTRNHHTQLLQLQLLE